MLISDLHAIYTKSAIPTIVQSIRDHLLDYKGDTSNIPIDQKCIQANMYPWSDTR